MYVFNVFPLSLLLLDLQKTVDMLTSTVEETQSIIEARDKELTNKQNELLEAHRKLSELSSEVVPFKTKAMVEFNVFVTDQFVT